MAAAANAARLDALEALLAQVRDQATEEREALVTINNELKAQVAELTTTVELQGSSAEGDRARSLVPNNLPSSVQLRIQPEVDMIPLAREAIALLRRTPEPDVERALLKLGQLYRLLNNVLAGADLAKQQPAAERPFAFIEHYYDQTKALALKLPTDADWKPETELVKHDAARKAAVKLVEAEIAKAARTRADNSANIKRALGRPQWPNGPPQQRPYTGGPSGFPHQPPPSGSNHGGQARGGPSVGGNFNGGTARGGAGSAGGAGANGR